MKTEIKFTIEERNFLMKVLGEMQLNPLTPGALEIVQKVNILAGKINLLTEGQKIAAENGNRVNDETVAGEFTDQFPKVRLVTVEDVFGGWGKVQDEHVASGALLDQIYGDR